METWRRATSQVDERVSVVEGSERSSQSRKVKSVEEGRLGVYLRLMGKLFVVQRKMHEDARERSKADERENSAAVNRKPSPAHASEGRGDVEMSRLSIGEATDRLVQIGEAHENGMECDEEDERSQFLPNSMSSSRRGMMSRVSGAIAMIIRHGCGRQVRVCRADCGG